MSMISSCEGRAVPVATSMRPANDFLARIEELNRGAYFLERRITSCQDESSCSFGSSP